MFSTKPHALRTLLQRSRPEDAGQLRLIRVADAASPKNPNATSVHSVLFAPASKRARYVSNRCTLPLPLILPRPIRKGWAARDVRSLLALGPDPTMGVNGGS